MPAGPRAEGRARLKANPETSQDQDPLLPRPISARRFRPSSSPTLCDTLDDGTMAPPTQPSPRSSTPLSYDSDTPLDRTPTERDALLNKQRSIDNALQSEFVTTQRSYGSDGGESSDRRDAGESCCLGEGLGVGDCGLTFRPLPFVPSSGQFAPPPRPLGERSAKERATEASQVAVEELFDQVAVLHSRASSSLAVDDAGSLTASGRSQVLSWLPSYSFSAFGGDVTAAFTLTSMLVPQAMSYSTNLANLPPITGLFGAAIPPMICQSPRRHPALVHLILLSVNDSLTS